MKKTITLAVLATLAATGASAEQHRAFQLLDSNGSALCELINLDQVGKIATGTVTGCGLKEQAGGLYGGVHRVSAGAGAWTVFFRETPLAPGEQFIVVLNEHALTWSAFSQTDGASQYAFLAEGTMEDQSNTPSRNARPLASLLDPARRQKPATPARGIEVHYTFANPIGTPFCDGLALTQSAQVAVGTHTGNSSCPADSYAGGNFGHVKAIGEKRWTIVTTDADLPNDDLVFVLDENAMTWTGYVQGPNFGTFHLLGSGVLLPGDPVDPPTGRSRPAMSR